MLLRTLFPDVRKMVDLGAGSQREADDVMLTRYACYLIVQNGDPRKPTLPYKCIKPRLNVARFYFLNRAAS